MTNDGIDVISVTKNTITRSGHLFRISAAIEPSTTPNTIAVSAAKSPSFAEIGKLSPMISEIGRSVLRLTPKSPCSTPAM